MALGAKGSGSHDPAVFSTLRRSLDECCRESGRHIPDKKYQTYYDNDKVQGCCNKNSQPTGTPEIFSSLLRLAHTDMTCHQDRECFPK